VDSLAVISWVTIRTGCPVTYRVDQSDTVDFLYGSPDNGFEFAFEADALRAFITTATQALEERDTLE
jgi:hypothetical protein